MKWFVISRPRQQPSAGNYSNWKPKIAEDCKGQCVYCSISEGEYGGIDNFHIDHFRPKSLFRKLENDIHNLFLACAICNRFKSDEWPGEPDAKGSTTAFLDPSIADYKLHILFDDFSFELNGTSVAGTFLINRLYLNRPQLLRLRRRTVVCNRICEIGRYFSRQTLHKLVSMGGEGAKLVAEFAAAQAAVSECMTQMLTARPYTEIEIKRKKNKAALKKPTKPGRKKARR